MIPPFDLQGGPGLVAVRDVSVTALLSAFGTIAFRNLVMPTVFVHMPADMAAVLKRRLLLLAQLSIAACVVGTLAWLAVQAADMADADSMGEAFAAVPTVLRKTSFGHVVTLQLAALVILALVLGTRDMRARQRAAFAVSIVTVALQAGHSHAESMFQGPSVLLFCDILHLLGAGAWLGGLLPLIVVVGMAPPRAGATAARWFSPIGQWCIGLLAVSALFQGFVLVATIAGLVGTAYGWMVLIKAALFAALLGFAYFNRYRFAPALLHDEPERARRILMRSIGLQTGFALAITVAAVVLSELPPAMHLQPLWPFKQQISFAAIQEDADFRREVTEAALALAVALALLVVCFTRRRRRLVACVAAAVIAWFALPHFDLLLATAYPTSFYHSPTGFSSETIVQGAGLFPQYCASCHGARGHGDGKLASSLPVPPADLTAAHLWMHSDGELFWWLSDGMKSPEGAQAMPGFAAALDENQRWALIDYIRANNAGNSMRQNGAWPHTVQAPGLEARCGTRTLQLADLRGRFVRLVIGAVSPTTGSQTRLVIAAGTGGEPAETCLVRDESVPAAYAIVAGSTAEALAGTQFLIDDQGWLRAMQRPGSPGGWDNPASLQAEIQTLRNHPLALSNAPMPMNMPM